MVQFNFFSNTPSLLSRRRIAELADIQGGVLEMTRASNAALMKTINEKAIKSAAR